LNMYMREQLTVDVTYIPKHGIDGPQLAIAWNAGDLDRLPGFEGTIATVVGEARDCTLTINGTCDTEPPTLEPLLRQLRSAVESDYAERTRWSVPVARR